MRQILLALYCFLTLSSFAQYSSIVLKEEDAKKLGSISKTATLILAINNEKDPADAALINAVKSYWKISKYKLISRAEFLNLQAKNELSKTDLYLYESTENISTGGATGFSNPALLSNVKTGVFCLSIGEQNNKVNPSESFKQSSTKAIKLRFDLNSTLSNSKARVLDGYYSLMVKFFNHEVEFCQKVNSFKEIKKDEKDGIVYFESGLTEIPNKDILLIKEQVNKSHASDKKNTKKGTPVNVVSQFNPSTKNVYTVFPEDIKMALDKNDNKVLIYSNDMLISAANGAVVAAPMNLSDTNSKGDPLFWAAALGVFVAAVLGAVILQ
jgi:hypothetical protein